MLIAPFHSDADCPVLLLRPDYCVRRTVGPKHPAPPAMPFIIDEEQQRAHYASSYRECHAQLESGKLQKIVLSRQLLVENQGPAPWNAVDFFLEACRLYPHNYVSCWWTERSGCWLVATPETLLMQDDAGTGEWQTMALAGTMKWEDILKYGTDKAWSAKNREEQSYVAQYIGARLHPYVNDLKASATYTARSADIGHLRTDFRFCPKPGITVGTLLRQLHPTPAVCGVPQAAARNAILHNETATRRYYAGFSGPVRWEGNTRLYVSLRCMELSGRQARLYAGGGLLKESRESEEWVETQRKMHTMLRLFVNDAQSLPF